MLYPRDNANSYSKIDYLRAHREQAFLQLIKLWFIFALLVESVLLLLLMGTGAGSVLI